MKMAICQNAAPCEEQPDRALTTSMNQKDHLLLLIMAMAGGTSTRETRTMIPPTTWKM